MARKPFTKPQIDYRPQIADVSPVEPVIEGDENFVIDSSSVISGIDALQEEISTAVSAIESQLADFAISDRNGVLSSLAKRVLASEREPLSISYDTYVSLGAYSESGPIREVFEEKAYSIWGNASIALIETLKMLSAEAVKAKIFLSAGVSDLQTLELIDEWVGRSRMFTVDAERVGSVVDNDFIEAEALQYADQAIEVQKSAVIGASTFRDEIKTNISRIRSLYGSDSVYDTHFDSKPTISDSGGSIVPVLVARHQEIADRMESDIREDISYRIQAFEESSDSLLKSVSQLRVTQMMNGYLAQSGGITDVMVDNVVVTTPDISFDIDAKEQIRKERVYKEDEPLSLEIVKTEVLAEVESLIPEEDLTWHDLAAHEALGLKKYDDLVAEFAAIDHDHDSDYLAISAGANFIQDSEVAKKLFAFNYYQLAADLTESSAVSGWRTPAVNWSGIGSESIPITGIAIGDIIEVSAKSYLSLVLATTVVHISASLYDGTTLIRRFSNVNIPQEPTQTTNRCAYTTGLYTATTTNNLTLKFELYTSVGDPVAIHGSYSGAGVEVYTQIAYRHYKP